MREKCDRGKGEGKEQESRTCDEGRLGKGKEMKEKWNRGGEKSEYE